MKTVFRNNEEVSHIWASRTQDQGRAGSIYFQKDVIFSYGSHFPVAKFFDKGEKTLVLFTSQSYSVTTAQHKSKIAWACNHYEKIYVPEVNILFPKNPENHEKNLVYFVHGINELRVRALKSRKHGAFLVQQAQEMTLDLKKYLQFFGLKGTKETKNLIKLLETGNLFSEKEKAQFKNQIKVERQINKEKRDQRKKEEEIARLEEVEKLNRWKQGENVQFSYRYETPIALRIKGEEIETTRGATVPYIEGVELYKAIIKGEKIEGRKIGAYTVNRIENEVLIVGCHRIPLIELDQVFGAMA